MRQYAGIDLEADREVANTIAKLIIGEAVSSDLPARSRLDDKYP